MNGNCGVNEYSNGVNLHTLGAFDRWFEHAGFVNGTFFDSEASGCVDLGDTGACQTPTFPGGEWLGRGDGYDTSTIGNVTIEWLDKIAKEEPERPWAVVRTAPSPASSRLPTAEGCCCCCSTSRRTRRIRPPRRHRGTSRAPSATRPSLRGRLIGTIPATCGSGRASGRRRAAPRPGRQGRRNGG